MASLRVSILELTLPIAAHHVGRSAYEHPQPVADYLAIELAAGHITGPFDPHELGEVTISRFGVITKANTGKWRLILDLSSPKDASVNDGIPSELCSCLTFPLMT